MPEPHRTADDALARGYAASLEKLAKDNAALRRTTEDWIAMAGKIEADTDDVIAAFASNPTLRALLDMDKPKVLGPRGRPKRRPPGHDLGRIRTKLAAVAVVLEEELRTLAAANN